MTIRSLYPDSEPSIALDFVNRESLDGRINFTRTSTGTYIGSDGLIKTAGSNVPRFDRDPLTGDSLGLLVEEARTNLLQYSSSLNGGPWANTFGSNVSLIANAIIAPDGLLTASKLVEGNTNNSQHWIYVLAHPAGTGWSGTFYAKAAERSKISLDMGFGGQNVKALFDLANVTATYTGLSTNASATTQSITPYLNGWYKCELKTSVNISGSGVYYTLLITNSSNNTTYLGDGTSGIYAWGAQLEQASFPTSYIPTVASTVTRAADVASMTGTNFSSWYNQSEGTMFVNARYFGAGSPEEYFFQVDDNSSSNFIKISKFGVTTYATVDVASAHTFETTLASIAQGSTFKAGLAYKTNSFAATLNGASPSTSTSGAVPSSLSRLRIGNSLGSSLFAQSTISRLAYYPVRLPDAQLQALTS